MSRLSAANLKRNELPASLSATTSTAAALTPTAAALQRLDDKLATGMTITDVANVRWLTPVEVLQYLDQAMMISPSHAASSGQSILCTGPPGRPPTSGTLLLYNAHQTPKYADDGMEWVEDENYNDTKWKSINGVLVLLGGEDDVDSDADGDADADNADTTMGMGDGPTNLASSSSNNNPLSTIKRAGEGIILGAVASKEELSSSALKGGAWAEYLVSADRPTFHRREYQAGPNCDIVLLHYLDSAKALRMTSELVDRIVLLSADSGHVAGGPGSPVKHDKDNGLEGIDENAMNSGVSTDHCGEGGFPILEAARQQQSSKSKESSSSHKHTRNRSRDLGDTMNILRNLVDSNDIPTTSTIVEAAVEENILEVATEAALSAVVKHISPDEAMQVVGAIEMAMEDDSLGDVLRNEGSVGGNIVDDHDDYDDDTNVFGSSIDNNVIIEDVTEFDIDEAINQVLSGENNIEDDGMMSDNDNDVGSSIMLSDASSKSQAEAAKIIENKILDSIEEVLPEDLKMKLITTTEKMLEVKGVNFAKNSDSLTKSSRKALLEQAASFGSINGGSIIPDNNSAIGGSIIDNNSSGVGLPLPEIVDITPEFYVVGYAPPQAPQQHPEGEKKKKEKKQKDLTVVLSTKTPIPELPPYVDPFYVWEKFVAFVSFEEVGDDPQVRNISFQRLMVLTPFVYKSKIPMDIPNHSIRHVVVVGVLLPKDHRVRRNMRGIELALKLCVQTEWNAAADLVGTKWEHRKSIKENSGEKPQIKGLRRPLFSAPCGGTRMQLLTQISRMKFTMYPANCAPVAPPLPDFVQNVAKNVEEARHTRERAKEEKRKRAGQLKERAAAQSNDASMSTAEVDRHRKVRFVERLSNAITDTKSASENLFEGLDVEAMNDDEIDSLLKKILVQFVEVLVEGSTSDEELRKEINYCGYAGLSLLHHACYYNFDQLLVMLLKHGANPNIGSAEGDATPLHFAAAAGHKDAVETLIKSGCKPCPLDSSGQTPADHARKAGRFEIAQALDSLMLPADREGLSDVTMATGLNNTTNFYLQSAFKELSLKDKMGLNLFVDRSETSFSPSMVSSKNKSASDTPKSMMEDHQHEVVGGFSFISKEDRLKLREAMNLVSEMDLQEMNRRAEHQDVRRYLRQSNYEAISAASKAMARANKKEADILKSASSTSNNNDPSKMQLSRALAMLVLRKNLPA